MLSRALFTPDGRVLTRRMIPTVTGLVALALIGGLLLAIAPAARDTPAILGALVTASVLAKLPLVAFIAWLMLRNREWPSRPARWSRSEVHEILAYIRAEAVRAATMRDARARLAYLRDEAWHVADRAFDEDTPEAVALALQIQSWIEDPERAWADAE